VGIQLAHAGRKASSQVPWDGGEPIARDAGGWTPVAPSAVPLRDADVPPAALGSDDIACVRQQFVDAARRAARLPIDAMELHFAHGYLLHQFLSPIANRRTDAWGGSFDNRVRFPLDVFAAVRHAWPSHRPLGVRVSATDWIDGGWTLDESIVFAARLQRAGCDWIDVSSGGISPLQKIPLAPGYQVPLARAIRAATRVPTMAVGLITDAAQAEAIVANGDADLVAMARAMLWDPRWPWHAAAALGGQVHAPQQYWRAAPHDAAQVLAHAKAVSR
jgi:2,4-dienoyl-CoA reductase-like NADH-dependent reductase (Old Yellow Enzyme family)